MTNALKLAFCIGGLAAFLYGVWSIYHPAAWILGGAGAFVLALVLDKHGSR